jgi:hypothetical protein
MRFFEEILESINDVAVIEQTVRGRRYSVLEGFLADGITRKGNRQIVGMPCNRKQKTRAAARLSSVGGQRLLPHRVMTSLWVKTRRVVTQGYRRPARRQRNTRRNIVALRLVR